MSLDPEIKARWIAALRSGNYRQHRGCLRVADAGSVKNCCCLGVLADIHRPDLWLKEAGSRGAYWFDERLGGLSKRISAEVGLSLEAEQDLVKFNDVDMLDFRQIAGWVERNL